MMRPTHHYIGRCKRCGAVWASVYDMLDDPEETGRAVGVMIARGLEVERVPLGSVEFTGEGCTCASEPTAGLPLFEGSKRP